MSASGDKPFPHLFSPLQLGGRKARNRVFRAATATNLAEKFDVSEQLLAHYATLARGGAGVIVTEAMRLHPSAVVRGSNIPGFDPKIIPGLTRWARDCARRRRFADRAGQPQRTPAQQHHRAPSLDRTIRDRVSPLGRRAARHDGRGDRRLHQAHGHGRQEHGASRARRHRGALRARPPSAAIRIAVLEQAHRPVGRQLGKPYPVPAGDLERRSRFDALRLRCWSPPRRR